jgi:NAD(P) transhydrogenase subunit alpha
MLALAAGRDLFTMIIGFIAVVFGAMNVVGGFWVTHRMLGMFKPDWARKKRKARA